MEKEEYDDLNKSVGFGVFVVCHLLEKSRAFSTSKCPLNALFTCKDRTVVCPDFKCLALLCTLQEMKLASPQYKV